MATAERDKISGYLQRISQLPRSVAGQDQLASVIDELLSQDEAFLGALVNFGATVLGLFKRVLLQSVQATPASSAVAVRVITLLSKTLPLAPPDHVKESRVVHGLKTLADFDPPADVQKAAAQLLQQLGEKLPAKLREALADPPQSNSPSASNSDSPSSSSSHPSSSSSHPSSSSSHPSSSSSNSPSSSSSNSPSSFQQTVKRSLDEDDSGEQVVKVRRGLRTGDAASGRTAKKSVRWLDQSGGALCQVQTFFKDRSEHDPPSPPQLPPAEAQIAWRAPLPLAVSSWQHRGRDSVQKAVQERLEKSTLAACYPSLSRVPPSPAEPEPAALAAGYDDAAVRVIVDDDPLEEISALLLTLGFTGAASSSTSTVATTAAAPFPTPGAAPMPTAFASAPAVYAMPTQPVAGYASSGGVSNGYAYVAQPAQYQPYAPAQQLQARQLCHFWKRGICRNGAGCPFLHSES